MSYNDKKYHVFVVILHGNDIYILIYDEFRTVIYGRDSRSDQKFADN